MINNVDMTVLNRSLHPHHKNISNKFYIIKKRYLKQ